LSDDIELKHVVSLRPAEFEEIADGANLRKKMLTMLLRDLGFPRLALVDFYANVPQSLHRAVELSADAAQVMGKLNYISNRSSSAIDAATSVTASS
jgi:hypothetical protein